MTTLDLHKNIAEIDINFAGKPVGHQALAVYSDDSPRQCRLNGVRGSSHVGIGRREDARGFCGNAHSVRKGVGRGCASPRLQNTTVTRSVVRQRR